MVNRILVAVLVFHQASAEDVSLWEPSMLQQTAHHQQSIARLVELENGEEPAVEKVPLSAAIQSATFHGGSASRAIDGNRDGMWSGGSCTHTADVADRNVKKGSWWLAKIEAGWTLKTIRVYNRMDCCSGRLTDTEIIIDGIKCGHFGSTSGLAVVFDDISGCITGNTTESSYLQLLSIHPLNICEVEVTGYRKTTTEALPEPVLRSRPQVDDACRWEDSVPGYYLRGSAHTIVMSLQFPSEMGSSREWILNLGQKGTGANHWLWNLGNASQIPFQFGAWNGVQVQDMDISDASVLASVYDGETYTVYKDGVQVGQVATSLYIDDDEMLVGMSWTHGERDFSGCVFGVDVYRAALNPSQVKVAGDRMQPASMLQQGVQHNVGGSLASGAELTTQVELDGTRDG